MKKSLLFVFSLIILAVYANASDYTGSCPRWEHGEVIFRFIMLLTFYLHNLWGDYFYFTSLKYLGFINTYCLSLLKTVDIWVERLMGISFFSF